jgi:hypothetical protein
VIANLAKRFINLHVRGGQPDVLLFATPRGGSTWFMELVCSQPGFRYCDEPLNVRSVEIRRVSGIGSWEELYSADAGERLERYFTGLLDGSIDFRNPTPFRPHYRFFTRRVVAKVIHGGVDRINWFRDTFNARILYVLRHPIAVSLSRQELPFLAHFLTSEYTRHFSREQVKLAREIIDSGTRLQRGVLAWCLHNSVPLRDAADDWTVVTWEQAVLQPLPVIERLCDRLALPEPDRIMRHVHVPSGVIHKSDASTQALLREASSEERQSTLVRKWSFTVTPEEATRAMQILEAFGIDAYRHGDFLPADKYWIGRRPGFPWEATQIEETE